MKRQAHYIITTDSRCATLHRVTTAAPKRWHVESVDAITNKWEDYHEHHRPIALGRGVTAYAAQSFASGGHEQEEELQRFARDIRRWVGRCISNVLKAEHVTLFAPPRLLGALRSEFAEEGDRVDLVQGELALLQPHELAEHRAVLSALATAAESKT